MKIIVKEREIIIKKKRKDKKKRKMFSIFYFLMKNLFTDNKVLYPPPQDGPKNKSPLNVEYKIPILDKSHRVGHGFYPL